MHKHVSALPRECLKDVVANDTENCCAFKKKIMYMVNARAIRPFSPFMCMCAFITFYKCTHSCVLLYDNLYEIVRNRSVSLVVGVFGHADPRC